jgi:hypothetical protein
MARSRLKLFVAAGIAVILVAILALTNIPRIAVRLAPSKSPVTERSARAIQADSLFWRIFHGGAYDQLPVALEAVTAAYLETPGDAVTASHAGFLHIWQTAEASRLDTVPATITDHMAMARRYFQESVALNPDDARTVGFLGGTTVGEGSIHGNEKLIRRGYYIMKDAIKMWPEFSLFTAGYVLSQLPADSPRFREGLEYQWETLDLCAGEKLDRKNPDYTGVFARETHEGPQRACWNSWIAPYNLEGFLLNHGDMLVKSGDWETAQKVYAIARLTSTYNSWPYRDVLEERIRLARENVAVFNEPKFGGRDGLMIRSRFACMACHQVISDK